MQSRIYHHKNGFTLIELMICVVIIGLLTGVVTSKISDAIQNARESKGKANLSLLRSTLNIYYSSNEGWYPAGPVGENQTTLVTSLVPKYLKEIPPISIYPYHDATSEIDNVPNEDLYSNDSSGDGNWAYLSDHTHASWGSAYVECYHQDTKGIDWSSR